MRLLFSTAIAFFVCAIFFAIIKIWSTSLRYTPYAHPLYSAAQNQPIVFKVITPENLTNGLKTEDNIYLDIAVTMDQKLIIIDRKYENEKQISQKKTFKYNNRNFSELISADSKSAVLIEQFKDKLQNKKIIFNMQDNPLQATTVFTNMMKNFGMDAGDNFIYVSPYDPPVKDLKSFKPTYLFGASDPEILKIKAMESLFLIEAATFRADVVIYPLMYYKQPFFTETLVRNLNRRYKKFIVGPVTETEYSEALKLNPFGIIKE